MHSIFGLVLALLARAAAHTQASNVVDLEESNFDQRVGEGKSALLDFWAPWCDHCQQLEPTYEELGDVFAHVNDKLIIAKVNHDVPGGLSLIEKYGVKALPTIKWIGADGESEDYDPEAIRTLDALVEFVAKKSGLEPKLSPSPPPVASVMTQLTPDNFNQIVNDPEKDVFVAFTATWCQHCQAMKPTYDLIALRFKSEKNVVIANIDGDVDVDHTLAKKYGVHGYPILKLFPKGSNDKDPIEYTLPKDEKNMLEFLNTHTGTQRAIGGGLSHKAGRSDILDELVIKFVAAQPSERQSIYKQAMPVAKKVGKSGNQYLRIMSKMVYGTDDFLVQEKTRLIGLLKNHALADEKHDEIQTKFNILCWFLTTSAANQNAGEGARVERSPNHETPPVAETVEAEVKRTKEDL